MTIMVISIVAFVSGWLLMAYFAWGYHCSSRTFADRDAIIDAIYSLDTDFYPRYAGILSGVPDRLHTRELMLFRDPWLLYPADLAEEAKRRRLA